MMDRNKYLCFNPQKCEKLLSNFGKKVLFELIKQHDKGNHRKFAVLTINVCDKDAKQRTYLYKL